LVLEPRNGEDFLLQLPLTSVVYDAGTAGFTFEGQGLLFQFSYTVDLSLPLTFYLEYRDKPYITEVTAEEKGILTYDTDNLLTLQFTENISVAGTTMSTPVAVTLRPGSSVIIRINF
jgi:hypothetical protein